MYGGRASATWTYHNGSESLGTSAGWYSTGEYNSQITEPLGRAAGRADGYAASEYGVGNGASNLSALNFTSIDEYSSWVATHGSAYNAAYSEEYKFYANRKTGRLEQSNIVFDIVSLGGVKFWTNVARLGLIQLPKKAASSVLDLVPISFVKSSSSRKLGEHAYVILDNKAFDLRIPREQTANGTTLGDIPLWGQPTEFVEQAGEQVALRTTNSVVTIMVTREQADLAMKKVQQISADVASGTKGTYHITCNSCASNAKEVLNAAGQNIPSHIMSTNQVFNYLKKSQ